MAPSICDVGGIQSSHTLYGCWCNRDFLLTNIVNGAVMKELAEREKALVALALLGQCNRQGPMYGEWFLEEIINVADKLGVTTEFEFYAKEYIEHLATIAGEELQPPKVQKSAAQSAEAFRELVNKIERWKSNPTRPENLPMG